MPAKKDPTTRQELTATKELFFHIDNASPHTLPMERLAEYLKSLAVLLGSTNKVHFLRVDPGSASCAIETEQEEEFKIVDRVKGIQKGSGPREALEAYTSLRDALERDDTEAELELEDGTVILDFPLSKPNEQETFGPFWEAGTVDGILVKIGGIDETVPVHLVGQGYHICNADHEMAKQLAPRLFGNPIRVHGEGKWIRNLQGKWEMQWFNIRRFEDLDDSSLPEVVSRLRAIPDNDLLSLKDPLDEMRKLRQGDE
jgi:hypothetical protein